MEKVIKELEDALDAISAEGYGNEHGFLTNDRNWHQARELLNNLKNKAALLNANPAMAHGLKAPPMSSGNVQ